MLYIAVGILTRIFSNSYLNVFQKILTNKGQSSSVINFYTYLGIALIGIFFLPLQFTSQIAINTIAMGLFGALGNYFIIKALSIGELSSIAPINSYKPIVAMIIAFIYLGETPSIQALFAILLIFFGTYYILGEIRGNQKAILFRILALIFSGTEAVFIKKIIILTDIITAFFLWAFSGLLFSAIFVGISKHKPQIISLKYQLFLILAVGIMQYSTNFVFSKMNVSYALALFQLSTLLSIFLGANIFKEKGLKRKLIGSIIMIIGATIIILNT